MPGNPFMIELLWRLFTAICYFEDSVLVPKATIADAEGLTRCTRKSHFYSSNKANKGAVLFFPRIFSWVCTLGLFPKWFHEFLSVEIQKFSQRPLCL